MIFNLINRIKEYFMLSVEGWDFRKRLRKAAHVANEYKSKDFFENALDILNDKRKFFDASFYPSSKDKRNGDGWNKILKNHSKNTQVLIDTFSQLCRHMVCQLRIEDMSDGSSSDKYKLLIAEIEKLQNYNHQPGEKNESIST